MIVLLAAACRPVQPERSLGTVTGTTPGAEVMITQATTATSILVESPEGIGQATLIFPDGVPPGAFEFRLALRSLEHFEVRYDETTVVASVPHAGQDALETVQRVDGGSQQTIGPGSPFWMAIRTPEANAAAPEFVVQAPPDLVSRRPVTIEVAWIDFYR